MVKIANEELLISLEYFRPNRTILATVFAMIVIVGTVSDKGVECPAVLGDDGRLYTIPNLPKDLTPGQRVTINGEELMGSFCQQGKSVSARHIKKHAGGGSGEKIWNDLKD